MQQTFDQFDCLDVRDVYVGGEIGRRIELTIHKNMLALDVETDFLTPFRQRNRHRDDHVRKRYIGLGKLIDAATRFAAYSGDERVTSFTKRLVANTIDTQLADGYIGTFRPEDRMVADYDAHESAYLIQGLVSDFTYFKRASSLEAAGKLAAFVIRGWHANPGAPKLCRIGLDRAFLALYRTTGEEHYREFCTDVMKLAQFDWPIEPRPHPKHKIKLGHHAYRHMDWAVAQIELYHMVPDKTLLLQAHRAVAFLTKLDGLVITGTCSLHEKFHDNQEGRGALGESCATAYLIRLMHHLLCLEGNARCGDIMERAIYNALFAAQAPDGRRLRYFTCFEGERAYFEHDFYCCPNNFRRIISELPRMIYYRHGGGVMVNLYTPSSATVELGGGLSIAVQQETDYPRSGRVAIRLDPSKPARFEVRLRIPGWCRNARVAVNGEPVGGTITPGRFLAVLRNWGPGDRIEVEMDISWRLIRGRRNQAGRTAVMHGPVVFCSSEAGSDKLTLDPTTLDGPVTHDAGRPGGMAVRALARHRDNPGAAPSDRRLLLTEYPDPDGRTTYFDVPNLDAADDDELMDRC